MDKQTLSRISTYTKTEILCSLAEKVCGNREWVFLKKPEKTMILLSVKEPVKQSIFYLGEMLAVHCIVELSGVRGTAVIKGDDFIKVEAAALLDAAHSGNFAEFTFIEPELLNLEEERQNECKKLSSSVKKTQVNFHVLEDREA